MSVPPSLPIVETFVSVQGEGRLAGTRSWFVRTSGCNLRCSWCDTPYSSWRPESEQRSIDDLVEEFRGSAAAHAVVTGGEPLLLPGVASLCARLRSAGAHVTIETAGTVWLEVECDLLSVSPKLSNSTPGDDAGPGWAERHEQRRINLPALQRLLDAHPSRQLKFVVESEGDLAEIEDLLASLRGVEPRDVMLMPEGTTPEALAARAFVEGAAADRGWSVSPRLHILLFGNTRGT